MSVRNIFVFLTQYIDYHGCLSQISCYSDTGLYYKCQSQFWLSISRMLVTNILIALTINLLMSVTNLLIALTLYTDVGHKYPHGMDPDYSGCRSQISSWHGPWLSWMYVTNILVAWTLIILDVGHKYPHGMDPDYPGCKSQISLLHGPWLSLM